MTDKQTCDKDCCKDFYDGYDEDDDNYVIQRLENIISICEFLIEHERNKKGKKILDDMLDKAQKQGEKKQPKYRYRYYYPLYVPSDRPKPWWSDVWF